MMLTFYASVSAQTSHKQKNLRVVELCANLCGNVLVAAAENEAAQFFRTSRKPRLSGDQTSKTELSMTPGNA